MFRQLFIIMLMISLLFWSMQSALAQVGGPPQRNKTGQPNNNQQPQRKPPPGPSAEDILKLLFPPEQFFPDDDPNDDIPPRPRRPRVLSTKEVSRLSPYQQRALLRKAVQSLDEDFDRIETGAGWKKHLQIGSLGSGVWCGKSSSPNAQTRAAMATIADRFDEVAGNPEFETVSELWGFQTIRAALREYAIEPFDLSKRKVRASSKDLIRSLGEVNSGAGWKKFLQTDEVKRLAKSKLELVEDDEDILRKIVEQFKKVAEKPDYRAISSMKGFKETYSSLEELADQIMQLKPSTSAAGARRMLKGLSTSLRAVNKLGKEKSAAQKAWEKATAGSPEADAANKVLMLIQQNQDKEEKRSEEQIDRLQSIIAQVIKENEAKRSSADPHGRLTLIPLDDDRKQMLVKFVANMRAINKTGKEKSAAQKA